MLAKLKFIIKELYKSLNGIYKSMKGYEYDEIYYMSQLSKCCHILDKGCYTVPFAKGHSINIYNDAKNLISKIQSESFINDPCYSWCKDRISKYEEMQKNDNPEPPKYCSLVKYRNPTDYMDFIKSAVSVRRFGEKVVDNMIIKECVETAQASASSCFRQTTRCYAIKSQEIIKKITPNIAGLTGFSNGIPLLFCITSDMRSYDWIEKDLCYIDASLFSQNLVLALRSYNVYSVFLSFFYATDKDNQIVKQVMSIPQYERIIFFIACGYSDTISKKPVRFSSDKIYHFFE